MTGKGSAFRKNNAVVNALPRAGVMCLRNRVQFSGKQNMFLDVSMTVGVDDGACDEFEHASFPARRRYTLQQSNGIEHVQDVSCPGVRPSRALRKVSYPGFPSIPTYTFPFALRATIPSANMTQETHAHVRHACWIMKDNVPDTCERTFPPKRTLLRKKWEWRASPFTQTGSFVEQSLI